MELEKLNSWLTLAANVGVLAGIFFLAYEIRQNTTVIESNAFQVRSDGLTSQFSTITDSEILTSGLAKLEWYQGNCEPDSSVIQTLTPEEVIAVQSYLRLNWFRFSNLFFQFRAGILDSNEGTLNAMANYIPWWDAFDVIQARQARSILEEFGFDSSGMVCWL